MKIHAALLFAATIVFGPHAAGAATLGLSFSLSSLDSRVCSTESGDCTETVTDIAPITASYSRSFESAFDVSTIYETPFGNGRTAYGSGASQGGNPPLTGLDRDPVFGFLPAINVTAEQLASGTYSTVLESFDLDAGKVVITQDGAIVRSIVGADLFETQQWATRLPSGAWLSTQYSIEFSLFGAHVPMTIAQAETPMSFGEFAARLEQQFLSGGDIPVDVSYIGDDGTDSIEHIDTYFGTAHLTSLDGLAPVPEAPVPLTMLAGLLLVGMPLFRASAARARRPSGLH